MEEAELYYKEAKSTGNWGKKSFNADTVYAFQATRDDDPQYNEHSDRDSKILAIIDNLSDLSIFTAQLKQFNNNNKWDRGQNSASKDEDSKYKWKLKAPNDVESTSKMVLSDGKRKKYHWCEYHKLWTIHSAKECKKQPTAREGRLSIRRQASMVRRRRPTWKLELPLHPL
jgi:hypothetical protein